MEYKVHSLPFLHFQSHLLSIFSLFFPFFSSSIHRCPDVAGLVTCQSFPPLLANTAPNECSRASRRPILRKTPLLLGVIIQTSRWPEGPLFCKTPRTGNPVSGSHWSWGQWHGAGKGLRLCFWVAGGFSTSDNTDRGPCRRQEAFYNSARHGATHGITVNQTSTGSVQWLNPF